MSFLIPENPRKCFISLLVHANQLFTRDGNVRLNTDFANEFICCYNHICLRSMNVGIISRCGILSSVSVPLDALCKGSSSNDSSSYSWTEMPIAWLCSLIWHFVMNIGRLLINAGSPVAHFFHRQVLSVLLYCSFFRIILHISYIWSINGYI